jgi:hypothetical protein
MDAMVKPGQDDSLGLSSAADGERHWTALLHSRIVTTERDQIKSGHDHKIGQGERLVAA